MLLPLNLALLLICKTWRGRFWSWYLWRWAWQPSALPTAGPAGSAWRWPSWCFWPWITGAWCRLWCFWACAPSPSCLRPSNNRILTIGNLKDSSTAYRFYIFDDTFTLLKDYWYRGVGLGSARCDEAGLYGLSLHAGRQLPHPHPQQLPPDVGRDGDCGPALLPGRDLLRAQDRGQGLLPQHTDRAGAPPPAAAAIGAFCGILVVSLAEYTWFYPRNMFTYWFLFGVILGLCEALPQRTEGECLKKETIYDKTGLGIVPGPVLLYNSRC